MKLWERTISYLKTKPFQGVKVPIGDIAEMKYALDTAVIKYVISKGYEEDHSFSNFRLTMSYLSIAVAVLAFYWPGSVEDAWYPVLVCVVLYFILSGAFLLFSMFVERDAIAVVTSEKNKISALKISSTFAKSSGEYKLVIEPSVVRQNLEKSIQPSNPKQEWGPGFEMANSTGRYFYSDGVLLENVLTQDVQLLLGSVEKRD